MLRDIARETLEELTGSGGMEIYTVYSRNWDKWFGGRDLGAQLTAELYVDSTNNVYLRSQGEANAWAFQRSFNLVRARALSEVVNQNGTLRRRFNGFVSVVGITLVNLDEYLTCGAVRSGTLLNRTQQFFSLSYTFYIAGILPVTLGLSASGTISVPYEYTWTACNAPISVGAAARVTPSAWVSASGGVTVSLLLVRGGASVTADLLKTQAPGRAEGRITNGHFQACFNLSLSQQAISGGVDLWYQTRGWSGWGTRHSWRIWSFGSATQNYSIFNYCTP
jgi:hypothetical protein